MIPYYFALDNIQSILSAFKAIPYNCKTSLNAFFVFSTKYLLLFHSDGIYLEHLLRTNIKKEIKDLIRVALMVLLLSTGISFKLMSHGPK